MSEGSVMDAPEELVEAVAEVMFGYWYGPAWSDVQANPIVDQYRDQARAVLAVPAIADALADAALLAKVQRIVGEVGLGDDDLPAHTAIGQIEDHIRGVAGEFYPCKPDIFAATYEREDA